MKMMVSEGDTVVGTSSKATGRTFIMISKRFSRNNRVTPSLTDAFIHLGLRPIARAIDGRRPKMKIAFLFLLKPTLRLIKRFEDQTSFGEQDAFIFNGLRPPITGLYSTSG